MEGSSTKIVTPVPKMAWNISPPIDVCSLDQVMSEELAKSLQNHEDAFIHKSREVEEDEEEEEEEEEYDKEFTASAVAAGIDQDYEDPDCKNDLILARLLQAEYDKEHNTLLGKEEKKFNEKKKITVSFVNYRTGSNGNNDCYEEDSSEESDIGLTEPIHLDSFSKKSPSIGKSGICKIKDVITTKHDANICGRRNACRVMEFPPGIDTGDGGGFDMKLPNAVYNKLKQYSLSEEKRTKKIRDKVDKSTAVQALDPRTRLMLFKLVNAGVLESIHGCISTGKESVVFHCFGGKTTEMEVPAECAIKVYKTTLNEFKNREKYIRNEFQFRDRFGKQNPRKIIRLWAEKELHNLSRLKRGGVPCPDVVTLKKHILVMSFIGRDQIPAQKLRDVELTTEQMQEAYNQVVEIMKTMFNVCHLVHADLSEYNILWHDGHPWIIDVSQAVERNNPQALEFLLRDCTNIHSFFGKNGVPNVLTAENLFADITGLDLPGEGTELLSQIQDFERNRELLTFGVTNKPYPFDSVFEKEHDSIKN